MSLGPDAASLALARALARQEAASPPRAKRRKAEKIEIDLTTPSPPAAAAATARDEALARQLQREEEEEAHARPGDAGGEVSVMSTHAKPPARLSVPGTNLVPGLASALSPFAPSLSARTGGMPQQSQSWTCGYENLAALLRCLAQSGRRDLPVQASTKALQQLVEAAWRAGFDPESAEQYGRRLVGKQGKAGWIGAAEMLVVLWHLRVDAMVVEIVDRDRDSGRAVFDAVAECFVRLGRGRPVVTPFPVVLQGNTHSRSILGCIHGHDSDPSSRAIVVRDPSDPPGVVRCLPPSDFDQRQWQLIVVRPGELGEAERRSRMGEPKEAAIWQHGNWRSAHWCPLRLPRPPGGATGGST